MKYLRIVHAVRGNRILPDVDVRTMGWVSAGETKAVNPFVVGVERA
jgi:hypothetical protein